MKKLKSILKTFVPKVVAEGDGAMVSRIIGGREVPELDPFLLLDHGKARLPTGFPDHPHRGLFNILYMKYK